MDVRQRVEQVVGECLTKVCHVVLSARLVHGVRPSPPVRQGSSAWFNLEVDEVPAAAQHISAWRQEPGGIRAPLQLEVYLQPWGAQEPVVAQVGTHKAGTPSREGSPGGTPAAGRGMLLERWSMHYQPDPQDGSLQRSRSQLARLDPPAIYKRMIIMIRALYSYVRVLPAYRLHRVAKRVQGKSVSLSFQLTRSTEQPPQAAPAGAAPMSPMEHFQFAPIQTPFGQFKLAVEYRPASTISVFEQSTAPVPRPQIIADYIRGPVQEHASGLKAPEAGASAAAAAQQQTERAPKSILSASLNADGSAGPQDPLQGAASPPVASGPAMARAHSAVVRRHSWSSQHAVRMMQLVPHSAGAAQQQPLAAGLPTPVDQSPPQLQPCISLPVPAAQQGLLGGHSPAAGRGHSTPPRHPSSLKANRRRGPRESSGSPRYAGTLGSSPLGSSPFGRSPSGPTALGSSPQQQGRGRTEAAAPGSAGSWLGHLAGPSPAAALGVQQQACPEARALEGGEPMSGGRQCSAPVCIPGASDSGRARSASDLTDAALLQTRQHATTMVRQYGWSLPSQGPASAPAAASMIGHAAEAGAGGGALQEAPPLPAAAQASGLGAVRQPLGSSPGKPPLARTSGSSGGSGSSTLPGPSLPGMPPPTPPAAHPAPHIGSASESSLASSYPASCSPQLPFAFTPSQHWLASLQEHQGLGTAVSPSPPISGRDVSALAVIRRPSWSSARTSSSDGVAAAATGGVVGYSVSPVQDSLESSLLSSGTPRHGVYGASSGALLRGPLGLPSPGMFPMSLPLTAVGGNAMFGSSYGPPRITYEPLEGEAQDESESDMLPFAIDGDLAHAQEDSRQQLAASRSSGPGGSDVEAFVRMVQEAPPLQRSGSMQDGAALSIDSALHQFELLKAQATQLASGIAPALAEQ